MDKYINTGKAFGYGILWGALGTIMVSLGPELQKLNSWSEALVPAFLGTIFIHAGPVIASYFGGKMVERHTGGE